jgi:hypothetical protein
MDIFKFSYFAPRGMAIAKCAKYLKKVCDDRPHISEEHKLAHLSVIAKHYYITQNNEAYYAVHQKAKSKTV